MRYPSYLMHFNKNHSSKTGQFTYGDGDSDGQIDERHRYTKGDVKAKVAKAAATVKTAAKELADQYEPVVDIGKKFLGIDENGNISGKTIRSGMTVAKVVSWPGRKLAGFAFSKTQLGKTVADFKSVRNYANKNLEGYGEANKKWRSMKKDATNNMYDKAANFYNSHRKN